MPLLWPEHVYQVDAAKSLIQSPTLRWLSSKSMPQPVTTALWTINNWGFGCHEKNVKCVLSMWFRNSELENWTLSIKWVQSAMLRLIPEWRKMHGDVYWHCRFLELFTEGFLNRAWFLRHTFARVGSFFWDIVGEENTNASWNRNARLPALLVQRQLWTNFGHTWRLPYKSFRALKTYCTFQTLIAGSHSPAVFLLSKTFSMWLKPTIWATGRVNVQCEILSAQ